MSIKNYSPSHVNKAKIFEHYTQIVQASDDSCENLSICQSYRIYIFLLCPIWWHTYAIQRQPIGQVHIPVY